MVDNNNITISKVVRNGDKAPGDGVGLPSVRKLLARFEPGQSEVGDTTDQRQAGNIGQRSSPDNKVQVVNTMKKQMRKEAENMVHNGKTNGREERAGGGETISGSKPLVSPPLVSETSRGKREVDGEKLNHTPTKQWNPQQFVKYLYKLPVIGDNSSSSDEDGPISLDTNQSCPSIEGYMERLPAGRKKSALWNSWKKQYFVAKSGNLFVYSNKSQDE